jgi:formylglycine-generating enzyme required for sulfatase activity
MRNRILFALIAAIMSSRPVLGAALIQAVPIGDPGNAAEANPLSRGEVGYSFRMGLTEVTNAQYVRFLNAVALLDPLLSLSSSNGE